MRKKLTSRKFWMATAAGLASVGASIAGIATDNEAVAAVGIGCTVASAAIYAAAEAYVDGKSVASTTTSTETKVTATAQGAAAGQVVDAVLPKQAEKSEVA